MDAVLRPPTDDLEALARGATAARIAASALRWLGACAAGCAFLLVGLALVFCGAGIAGVLAHTVGFPTGARWSWAGRIAFVAGVYALVLHPLWPLLDPAVFYDRTRTLGSGASGAFFVAAFAGTLSGAAARALLSPAPQAQQLSAFRGRPALLAAARIAALDAAEWLLPPLPALPPPPPLGFAQAHQDAGPPP